LLDPRLNPNLGGPVLRIYDPRRQGGPGTVDLGSRFSLNDKNCEPVTGSM
jgi:hypothetical protein